MAGVSARADVRRSVLQTLLVGVGCVGAVGLLSGRLLTYPGEHSLKLGTPGLYYAAPLGLVYYGVEWRRVASAGHAPL